MFKRILSCDMILLYLSVGISFYSCVMVYFQISANLATSNPCTMTYSWPVYTPLPIKNRCNYKLYALHMVKAGNLAKLSGIPVLFVPGHLGSYKQSRSFGRHAFDLLNSNATFKPQFDYFTMDFNEELTALSGDVMWDQAYFVNIAIQHILGMYNHTSNQHAKRSPQSVIIIAHSMGGMVARTALSLSNYKVGTIQTLISLSSPHLYPPLGFDRSMQSLYDTIIPIWRSFVDVIQQKKNLQSKETCSSLSKEQVCEETLSNTKNTQAADESTERSASSHYTEKLTKNPSYLENVVVISLAGGSRDLMIHSSLTSLDGIVHPHHGFSAETISLTDVKCSIDHYCLLWCYELLRSITLGLADMIDSKTGFPWQDPQLRLNALKNHFVKNNHNFVNDHNALEVQEYDYGVLEFIRIYGVTAFPICFAIISLILATQIYRWQLQFHPQIRAVEHPQPFLTFLEALSPKVHLYGGLPPNKTLSKRIWGDMGIVLGIAGAAGVAVSHFPIDNLHWIPEKTMNFYWMPNSFIMTIIKICFGSLYLYILSLGGLILFSLMIQGVTKCTRALNECCKYLQHPTLCFSKRLYLSIFGLVVIIVFGLGHIEEVGWWSTWNTMTLEKELSLFFLALLVFQQLLLFSLVFLPTKKDHLLSYHHMIFTMYLLVSPCWMGNFVQSLRYIHGMTSHNKMAFLGDLILSVALLLPIMVHLICARNQMIPLPPTVAIANGFHKNVASTAAALHQKKFQSPSECPHCFYEEGGPHAIYEESQHGPVTRVGKDVVVGSQFRVISCNCEKIFQQEQEYCSFCKRSCSICGGSPLAQREALRYLSSLQGMKDVLEPFFLFSFFFGGVALFVLFFALWKQHRLLYVASAIGTVMSFYHRNFVSVFDAPTPTKPTHSTPVMYEVRRH